MKKVIKRRSPQQCPDKKQSPRKKKMDYYKLLLDRYNKNPEAYIKRVKSKNRTWGISDDNIGFYENPYKYVDDDEKADYEYDKEVSAKIAFYKMHNIPDEKVIELVEFEHRQYRRERAFINHYEEGREENNLDAYISTNFNVKLKTKDAIRHEQNKKNMSNIEIEDETDIEGDVDEEEDVDIEYDVDVEENIDIMDKSGIKKGRKPKKKELSYTTACIENFESKKLYAIVSLLSEKEKTILIDRAVNNLDFSDIAEKLNMCRQTASNKYDELVKKLIKQWNE